MQGQHTPSQNNSDSPHKMSIMANGHQLQIDLEKVKGQLLEILKDHPTYVRDLTQYQMTPTRSHPSHRGPGLGMSGIRLQNRYNQKMKMRRTPSCRECGSPYSVHSRAEQQGQPDLVAVAGTTPVSRSTMARPSRRAIIRPTAQTIISKAVLSTVVSHAFPGGTPESHSPAGHRRLPKRRSSPLTAEHRREYIKAKKARRSSSVQMLDVSKSIAVDESVSLSRADLTESSVDVDTFPLMLPKMCSPKEPPKLKSADDLADYKTIQDISCISRSSRTNLREHLSGSDSVLQPSNAMHSTFNYPLHSTMNYPLHSTMANADLNLEMTMKLSDGQTSGIRSVASSNKKCGSSKDSSCDCTECLDEDADPGTTPKPPSAAFGDYVTRLEGLAARLLSPRDSSPHSNSNMKRQTGQLQLSDPRPPVQLSESTFCATVLNNSSLEATKGSAPEIDVDREPTAEDMMRERLHMAGLVNTPLTRTGRLTPEGSDIITSRPTQHTATPYPVYQKKTSQVEFSHKQVSGQIAPEHLYEIITPKPTPDYENLPASQAVMPKRRKSSQDKENSAPPALPPRCPTRTPSSYIKPRLPVPACFTEMDSVLSARPGCFNILKSSSKKRKASSQDLKAYDLEKRRRLAEKMKIFQRSLSNVKVTENEQVTLLGHL